MSSFKISTLFSLSLLLALFAYTAVSSADDHSIIARDADPVEHTLAIRALIDQLITRDFEERDFEERDFEERDFEERDVEERDSRRETSRRETLRRETLRREI